MRIGFVAEPYEESHASGMGFVVAELLREMLVQGKGSHEFVVYCSEPVSRSFIEGSYREVRIPKGFVRKWWWFYRMRPEVDALLFMAPMLPLVVPRSVRPIVVCQELGSQKIKPEGFKDRAFAFLRDRMLMPWCLRRASAIGAASNATKTDILKYYSIPKEKVEVIYDGYQDLNKYAAQAPALTEELAPFFFFAGKVKYRKNVHGIAAAFVEFKKRTGAPVKLVIAGDYGGEYYDKIMQILREGGYEREAHFVGYINSAQLYTYFKNAVAVVFPSINEGFGMPIIEAMNLGTPVITSNISSMAEAAGAAGLLVNPFDVSDISKAMERVWSDESLRAQLRQAGAERAKDFSWQKAGKEFISLVERSNG